MKIVKRIFFFLIILVVALAVIGLFLPGRYHVERSVVIQAKPDAIYPYVGTLKKWQDWTAWTTERFPDMKVTYEGPESGAGATHHWEGQSSGQGTIKLVTADPAKGVTYHLDFEQGKYVSKGSISMEPAGDGTRVVWVNEGDLDWNPINRYFGLLMDRFMGPDFEQGLNNLKKKVETK